MPFIGNQPALSYTSFAKQDFTTSATTSYTLDNPVANANELALFINFVRQEPTTAYSASGTTLTLTSATSSSDDMYCVYLGKAVQTVNPPAGSVDTSQLVDSAVTYAKSSGFGKIAQVIQVVDDTEITITSTSHTDTGLSASIVPSSTSSKILVKVVHQCYFTRADDNVYGGIKLLRNTTEIFNPVTENTTGPYGLGITVDGSGSSPTQLYWNFPLEYLDSPNTTSSITYKTQARVYQSTNTGQFVFNDNSSVNDGKSVITLMEILP